MVDAVTEQRRAAADAVRHLAELLITTAAPPEEIAAAAKQIADVAKKLSPWAVHSRYELPVPNAEDARAAYMETHPLLGKGNPIAPPLRSEALGPTPVVTGAFDARYEGPPGLVHAGFIGFGFEFVLGSAASSVGSHAFSVSTTVGYRKPLRVQSPVRFAAEVERVDGRKIFTRGTLTVDGELCAQAEGLSIVVDDASWNQGRRS